MLHELITKLWQPAHRSKTIAVAVVILLAVAIAIGGVRWYGARLPWSGPAPEPDANLLAGKDAYALALERAHTWKPDAVLTSMTSKVGATGVTGRSDDWEALFVSSSTPRRALRVTIANRIVTGAEEITYVATGAPLPDTIIPSRQAVTEVHAIKGYEKEPVQSSKLLYGPDGKTWYWAIQTPRGVTTVKAQ